jgi:TolB protein
MLPMAAVVVLLGACQEAPQPVEPIAPAPSHAPGNKPGGRIAFTSDRDGNFEIYVMNADGTALTRLTDAPDNFLPSWSPSGKQIAFTSNRDGNNEIYIVNADGTRWTNVTLHPSNDTQPDWAR